MKRVLETLTIRKELFFESRNNGRRCKGESLKKLREKNISDVSGGVQGMKNLLRSQKTNLNFRKISWNAFMFDFSLLEIFYFR